jgi:hypothetical protein
MENNGRVNLFGPLPPSAGGAGAALSWPGDGRLADGSSFSGFAYQTSSEKQFQGDMLRGNWEQNALSTGFFSKKNIDTIQNTIRRTIYDRKGYVIDNQSVDELKIVMRALFYQYARNEPGNPLGQIEDLNRRVVQWCVPHILSAVEHHMYYLKDIDTLPVPMSHPVNISRAGTRTKPIAPYM